MVREKCYRWTTLPMGHSHSPVIVQAFGWIILVARKDDEEQLFDENEVARMMELSEPPQYLTLKGGGFATLYYDNFLAVGPAANEV